MSWSPPLCACELLLTGSLIISSRPRRGWSQVRRSRSPDNCLILKIVNKMCQHGILFALIIAWQFIFLQILALYLSNIQQILLLTLQGFCGYFIHFPKSTDNRLTFCLNIKKLHVKSFLFSFKIAFYFFAVISTRARSWAVFEVELRAQGKLNFLLTIIFTLCLLEEHHKYASVFNDDARTVISFIFRIMMYTHKQQTFVYHNKTLVVTLLWTIGKSFL